MSGMSAQSSVFDQFADHIRTLSTNGEKIIPIVPKDISQQAQAIAKRFLPKIKKEHRDEGVIATFMTDPRHYGEDYVKRNLRLMGEVCRYAGIEIPEMPLPGYKLEYQVNTSLVAARLATDNVLLPDYENHGVRGLLVESFAAGSVVGAIAASTEVDHLFFMITTVKPGSVA